MRGRSWGFLQHGDAKRRGRGNPRPSDDARSRATGVAGALQSGQRVRVSPDGSISPKTDTALAGVSAPQCICDGQGGFLASMGRDLEFSASNGFAYARRNNHDAADHQR